MKKCKKTYAVHGLMEYVAVIKHGRSVIRVPFTEGSMNACGVTPAKFTTDNFMIQHAIEHSADFRSGKIKLHGTVPLEGEVAVYSACGMYAAAPAGRAKAPAQNHDAGEAAPADETEAPVRDHDTDGAAETAGGAEVPAQDHDAGDAVEVTADEGSDGGALVRVEVSCHEEAVEYLRDKYSIASSKLRSKVAVARYAEQAGIEFVYPEGE